MSRLKKYTKITPLSWDTIDTILKLKDSGLSTNISIPEECNLIVMEVSSMRRGFCKCGEVFGIKDDIKGNPIRKCPVCGNDKYISLYKGYGKSEFANFKKMEVLSDKVILKRTSFFINETIFETELSLESTEIVDAVLTEDNVDIKSREINQYSFDNYLKITPFKYDYQDEYLKTAGKSYYGSKFELLKNLLFLNKQYPNLMKDFKNYPIFITYLISTKSSSLTTKTSIESIIKDFIRLPKEFNQYFKRLFEQEDVRSITGRYYFSSSVTLKDQLNVFENFHTIKTNELKTAVSYIIKHTDITATNLKNLLDSIAKAGYSLEEEIFFAKHLLANYCIKERGVVSEFNDKLRFLKDKGYVVSEETLDKRNFNLIRNSETLKTIGFADERVSLFTDAFDVNPLESIKYLDTKRAPAKKLKEEMEVKMDKKYS